MWCPTVSALAGKVSDPLAFLEASAQPEHRFLLLGVMALFMWMFGLAYASRWTHDCNAKIVGQQVALMRLGDQFIEHSPSKDSRSAQSGRGARCH